MRVLIVAALLAGLAGLAPAAAGTATLTVQVTRQGAPLAEPRRGKFFVHAAGEKGAYLAWGWSGRSVRVPAGSYDLVVRYVEDGLEEVEVFDGVELRGDVSRTVDFAVPLAHLTLHVTSAGSPVPLFSGGFRVFRAGKRGAAIAGKRPGQTLTILPGTYDIEVTWRAPEGLRTRWLEGYAIRSEHVETVELGAPVSR